jgi:hypothetical protein
MSGMLGGGSGYAGDAGTDLQEVEWNPNAPGFSWG